MFNRRERELDLRMTSTSDIAMKEIYDLRKEFQEFRAVVLERDRLKERMWKERIAFLGLLMTSWGITIATLIHLVKAI